MDRKRLSVAERDVETGKTEPKSIGKGKLREKGKHHDGEGKGM